MTTDNPTPDDPLTDEDTVAWHVLNVRDARRYYLDTLARRDEELRSLHAAGRSMYQLAAWSGMSNAHVQRICGKEGSTHDPHRP